MADDEDFLDSCDDCGEAFYFSELVLCPACKQYVCTVECHSGKQDHWCRSCEIEDGDFHPFWMDDEDFYDDGEPDDDDGGWDDHDCYEVTDEPT